MIFPPNPKVGQSYSYSYVDCLGAHWETWEFTGDAWVKVS